jgi:hypothetical protein
MFTADLLLSMPLFSGTITGQIQTATRRNRRECKRLISRGCFLRFLHSKKTSFAGSAQHQSFAQG